jgi:malonyl-CoA decarboxylase
MRNKYPKLDAKIEKIKKSDQLSKIKDDLLTCLGEYFFKSERSDKMPNDPVARFHLGNGASLEQINFLGDTSSNGIKLSGGLMVNYLYDLEKVEQNHEIFVSEKKINVSKNAKNSLIKYYKEID